jgi:hypothetical protein
VSVEHDHEHVRLLVGYTSSGEPSHEMTPARPLEDGDYLILGTPGLANGCAAGDRVRVDASGAFTIIERGTNVAVHFYASSEIDHDSLFELRAAFDRLGAATDWPVQRRFIVVTVPVDAGFRAIEEVVDGWLANRPDIDWNYGNVYDDEGDPIGWWT